VLPTVLGACAGPLAIDFSSASLGTHADGTLRHPAALPLDGDGYTVPRAWRVRRANYGSDELVGSLVRAARRVEHEFPGGVAAIGDLSLKLGGGSPQHRSHHSGRDVDVFYYAVDRSGRPVTPGEAMLHFAADGRAARWSPPKGVRAPAAGVPDHRFDGPRNWAFVRALLSDPGVEVQWIFAHRSVAAALLAQGAAVGDDPALIARAAFILKQPSDGDAHDDHMHIRVYCAPADRRVGCVDKGPVRWWKKMWKYMDAPFGRPGPDSIDAAGYEALGRVIRAELPATFLPAPPTS
jgi:penicillin-insensitive murein endopeptidase